MADLLKRAADALRRLIGLLARPVKRDRGRGGLHILPYRGYGSRAEIFLIGRVFRQARRGDYLAKSQLGRDLRDVLRRLGRRGVAGVVVRARFGETKEEVLTDRDGHFRVSFRPLRLPSSERLWHTVDLELSGDGDTGGHVTGEVFIPPPQARFVVISDIDDTVVFTGVADKLRMFWRLFVQGAHSRIAFPGVGAFYRALHDGDASGGMTNPILYVSRGPWGLYDVLDEFFRLHRIPVGPILFLREWGLSWRSPLPRKAEGHKLRLIERMLEVYPDLPFVLIGDSGQHDPEIYARIVQNHPGRVLAVYIRNVSRNPRRIEAIEELAERLARAGSPLLLAADSFAMAEHAAARGLIDSSALREVVRERRSQKEGRAARRPVSKVRKADPLATAEAVRRGELEKRLEEAPPGRPPNVSVEPGESRD